ncbi:hypothetical protein Tco_0838895 [Tanacetum coccineum]|uniref:Uncharacterized protein n=1 Tax=Tanacetum coccineum TaxID=301880 RepID=A0ABQ5APZ5_9ASTR
MPHFAGDYGSVLCVVLLSAAIDTTIEKTEAEMGRHFLHIVLDGSSNPLDENIHELMHTSSSFKARLLQGSPTDLDSSSHSSFFIRILIYYCRSMPKSIQVNLQDTTFYIPKYHKTDCLSDDEKRIYKNLERRYFHEGRVIHSSYLDDQPNLCQIFSTIDQTLSIACVINNVDIRFRLEEFARILRIPCQGVCVFSTEWSISSLSNSIDPNPNYLPPVENPQTILDAIFYERPPGTTRKVPVPSAAKAGSVLKWNCPASSTPQLLFLFAFNMASSVFSSTKNPSRKLARTSVIDISSNESSPIQQNNPIPITLNTTLALTITPPMFSQTTLTQPIETSPLAPRALILSTPPSLPIEPHPYLTSIEDLPPQSSNPPPPPPSQGFT